MAKSFRYLSRRELLCYEAVAALAIPFGAAAQSLPRVAFLAQIRRPEPFVTHIFGSFAKGLQEEGYVDGQNISLDWNFANGDVNQLPTLAAAIVTSRPDVIVTAGTLSAVAMHAATSSLPVVFGNVSDPIASGLVRSMNEPRTNMTGVLSFSAAMMPKLAEITLEAMPQASRFALLINPLQPSHSGVHDMIEPVFSRRSRELHSYNATSASEIELAFVRMVTDRVEAVLMPLEGLFIQQREQIGRLSNTYGIAAASIDAELVPAGGLLAYGVNQHVMFRRMAQYVDRILKGAKPLDLPVEQPSDFVLAVSRKTAHSLGFEIPEVVLLRAGQIID